LIRETSNAGDREHHPVRGNPGGASPLGTGRKATEPAQLGRALVLVGSGPATAVDPAGSRPLAGFLAELIATAQQAPQTRRRRRAEPKEASAIYAAISAPAARMGRALRHSM
jgi:hypothetical protein